MTNRLRRRLLHVGSFVLGGGLLYLALRGIDFQSIAEAFRAADYRWVGLLVALVVGANLMRAWRWNVMIDALPLRDLPGREPEEASAGTDTDPPGSPEAPANADTAGRDGAGDRSVPLEASFSSIMLGYMINYLAPRMGEFARTANMAARTDLRFSSLLGTVVSERIFDTAVLGMAILSAFGLLVDRMPTLRRRFIDPAVSRLEGLSMAGTVPWVAAAGLVLALLAAWAWRSARDRQSALHGLWRETLKPALNSFRGGMLTLVRSPRRGEILASTVGMWGGYLGMAYVPFLMLDLSAPYGIGILDAWALMAIGALGMVVPSPGGIGSYHYITIQALVYLYAVPEAPAASYAFLAWGAQFIFYTVAGIAVLLYQRTGLGSLLSASAGRTPAAAEN
jgi:hypothetical protein